MSHKVARVVGALVALAVFSPDRARAQPSPTELYGLGAFGTQVTLCIPGVAFTRPLLSLSEFERMTWIAAGYAMSRAGLVDDVAQLHCSRGGRPDDAGGLGQLAASNALSLALAALDFALAGWKSRRVEGDRVYVFLVPFTYPAYRGISAYGLGLRVAF